MLQTALGPVDNGQFYDDLAAVRHTIADAIKRSLLDIELVRDSHIDIPVDGNVHEATSKTLNFLKRLYDYCNVVTDLLPPDPRAKSSSQLLFLFTGMFVLPPSAAAAAATAAQ
jgi:hypothetical protein